MNRHPLFELAAREGYTLVIDDGASERPDRLGAPQRDELCAQACRGNVIAIRSTLPLDRAFYAVSHEIAEDRSDYTGHHQLLWREQLQILARWCRRLAEIHRVGVLPSNGILEDVFEDTVG